MKAFGKSKAIELLKHWPYISVYDLSTRFTHYSTPKVGDIVMFYSSSQGYYHTGLVISVNGSQFTTIEGNTSGGSGIDPNGGGVFQKIVLSTVVPYSPDRTTVL